MLPYTFPNWFKQAGLAMLASLAPLAWAEPQSATVRIPDGDLRTARSEAVREILWEAGMRANAIIRTQSALIDSDLHETTVIRTAFRLKKFQIVREEISQDRLQLTADIEREDIDAVTCEPSLPLQNIAYAWEGTVGERASESDTRAGQLLGAAIARRLQADVAAYLQDADAPKTAAIYRIGAALEWPGKDKSGGVLRLQLRAATTDRLLREIRLPAGPQPLARQEESNLGYALLRQWAPTAAAHHLADEAAKQLADAIRCLPAVVRIPRQEADGGFSLKTRFPMDFSQRGLVLFFSAWPVTEGGAVDLLQADGYLKPQQVDERSVFFPGGTRLPGQKYPVPGGYLLVL